MTIAFDKQTRFDGTADASNTFTPIGTPRGILVLIDSIDAADHIAGVNYNGIALTDLVPGGFIVAGVGGNHVMYAFLLGSGVPAGAQTLFVDTSSPVGAGWHATCISLTAASDIELEDTTTVGPTTAANPTVALTIASNSFCVGMVSTTLTAANIAPGASFTQVDEYAPSTGTTSLAYRTTNPATNTSIDWVAASSTYGALAVAVTETPGTSRDMAAKVSTADNAKQGLVLQFR